MLLTPIRPRLEDRTGFALIELLVVILIVGILAAIAIPAFLDQRAKANDAGAKEIARTAETVMESYATNNDGSYSGATVSTLNSIEPSLITASASQAYLQSVIVPGSANTYTVIAYSPASSESYSIAKNGSVIARSCSPGGGGGCPAGGSWWRPVD
jgi:type IV pilus assembly protein PilA